MPPHGHVSGHPAGPGRAGGEVLQGEPDRAPDTRNSTTHRTPAAPRAAWRKPRHPGVGDPLDIRHPWCRARPTFGSSKRTFFFGIRVVFVRMWVDLNIKVLL